MNIVIINKYHSVNKNKIVLYENNVEIGSGCIIIDYKDQGKPSALIEDIFVVENRRKEGIGSRIVLELVQLARNIDCYKVVLNCSDSNLKFYESIGFKKWQNGMKIEL